MRNIFHVYMFNFNTFFLLWVTPKFQRNSQIITLKRVFRSATVTEMSNFM